MQHHIPFFKQHLLLLPQHYTSTDSNRTSLAYFCISSLDLLNYQFTILEISQYSNWIYSQLTTTIINNKSYSGFRGGPFSGISFDPQSSSAINSYDVPHITMTYTALVTLLILGDSLSKINSSQIISELSRLQTKDGSFRPCILTTENDMRFLYCACCISYILNDFSGINIPDAKSYIQKCKNYDGGYSQGIGQESHGGSTFCAIASLFLLNLLDVDSNEHQDTIFWLLKRQRKGFQGRVNKPEDTCYSFWVGGALEILNASCYIDFEAQAAFLSTTESKYGGYGKHADSYPDLLHSYMGLCGLSIAKHPSLKTIFVPLGLSQKSLSHLKNLPRI